MSENFFSLQLPWSCSLLSLKAVCPTVCSSVFISRLKETFVQVSRAFSLSSSFLVVCPQVSAALASWNSGLCLFNLAGPMLSAWSSLLLPAFVSESATKQKVGAIMGLISCFPSLSIPSPVRPFCPVSGACYFVYFSQFPRGFCLYVVTEQV